MNQLDKLSGIAHWLPRLSLAATFIYHGYPKLLSSSAVSEGMGMPVFLIILVGLAEIGGALLILWGGFGPDWATRLGGLLFAAVMIGAIFIVHAQNGWNSIGNAGMEFQVLILSVSLLFAFKGNVLNNANKASEG
ncbi:DoxX family protein [Balneola sp. MJW-20]|uniref:DoxX family protein n=1 Tax=Gracilimonas aurantiaca TaxID=3234185 RepID=UPI0034656431